MYNTQIACSGKYFNLQVTHIMYIEGFCLPISFEKCELFKFLSLFYIHWINENVLILQIS